MYMYMYVEKKVSNVLLRDGGNPTTEGHIFVKKKAPSVHVHVPVSVFRQRRGFALSRDLVMWTVFHYRDRSCR